MNKTIFFKFILLFAFVGFVGCSSDDSSSDDGGGENPPVETDISFEKRVLIEDFTGTWCGNCPRVSHAVELVKQETNKVVAVAIHGPEGAGDPYFFDATALKSQITFPGYPTATLDRTNIWNAPEPSNVPQAVDLTGNNAPLGITIGSKLENGNLNVDVSVKFGKDFSNNLKLVVYILENGLIHDQVNYFPEYYGGDNPIVDFEHNHVLRTTYTNLLGDAIPSAETTLENVYTANFSQPVLDISNTANIEIAAFVVDGNGTALNARSSAVGETQEFQEQQ